MITRFLSGKILELAEKYPVISLTGPRQSGKTSLARYLFRNYKYHNLENIDTLTLAQADPKAFLNVGSGEKIIIDEVQKFPELLSYIQTEVDEKGLSGQFIITGSQNLAISQHLSQTLAGRVANFALLPLSYNEIKQSEYTQKIASLQQAIILGSYPRAITQDISPEDFFQDYVATYVERDVRQIKQIGDLSTFQRFLQLVAGRVGQIINYSSLANDTGVNYKTIIAWLSILEASYITYSLQPYYENYGKRVIKAPKILFYDVGLLCYLLRIRSLEELVIHFAYGSIVENFIINEVKKSIANKRMNETIYFWRDSNGNEIDLITESGGKKQGIEIKAGQTFSIDMLKGLSFWKQLDPNNNTTQLVYTGTQEQSVQDHKIVNWKTFVTLL